jgi:hypothetical protein
MDDKGYAFTPLVLLLFIPVIIIGVSFSGIVNELNSLSSIAIAGDVTTTVATNVIKAIRDDTADAGRNAAYTATRTVIDNYNGNNNPFFGKTSPDDSRSYVKDNTLDMLNQNITNTCRELEKQTGRNITINGFAINPSDTSSVPIFNNANINIVESDPFGFNITLTSVPVVITQNSTSNNQSFRFNTPPMNVYVSIAKLEDPYIWINTYARNSSVIIPYPYYTQSSNIVSATPNDIYHFADKTSAGKLNYLNEELIGSNETAGFGYMPYYFPDPRGLSFFDRLENRTNNTSSSPTSARISTFILWNPVWENVPGYTPSYLDHEYFAGINGTVINTTHNGVKTPVSDPLGNTFFLSDKYKNFLGLDSTSYPY